MENKKETDNKDPINIPIKTLLDEYRIYLEALGRSPKTIIWYQEILVKYFTFIGAAEMAKSIADIGQSELKTYILHLQQRVRWPNNKHVHDEKHLSPYSIAGHVRAIKAFWSWLLNQDHIDHNPLEKFPLPKTPQNLINTLTVEKIKKLLNTVDRTTTTGDRLYCVLLLLIDTGARISEVLGIRIADIDWVQSIIKVTGKGQKERLIPFDNITKKTLLKYIKGSRQLLCSIESECLFPSRYGDHISVNSVQQNLRRLAKKVGIDNCHPHLLRHTFATLFIANNGSQYILKEIMGHKSSQTTEKYIHPQPQDLKKQHLKYSPLVEIFKE